MGVREVTKPLGGGGSAGLEPLTCLVTDVLAGACVFGKGVSSGQGRGLEGPVSSLGPRKTPQGLWTPASPRVVGRVLRRSPGALVLTL